MGDTTEQIPPPSPASDTSPICPVCRTAIREDGIDCPTCRAKHHQDCWVYNDGCGKYGCTDAPPTQKLEDMEVPTSFWGQTEKECPACHNRIQAAALRCRFCGTIFATIRPQDTAEFQADRSRKYELPRLRRAVIALLVFSILPCTAVLALIIGGIWYANNRQRLSALPAQQVALAKIALLIATIQSLILVVVMTLHVLLTRT